MSEERDHVDRWLAERELPGVDKEVEGLVDRINGLNRRLHKLLDQTLSEFGLSLGDWKVLNYLESAEPPYRRSVGKLAARAELSSGAMTNRLDRLEEANLVRRVPDPDDRRGVAAGERDGRRGRAGDRPQRRDARPLSGSRGAGVSSAAGLHARKLTSASLRRCLEPGAGRR